MIYKIQEISCLKLKIYEVFWGKRKKCTCQTQQTYEQVGVYTHFEVAEYFEDHCQKSRNKSIAILPLL